MKLYMKITIIAAFVLVLAGLVVMHMWQQKAAYGEYLGSGPSENGVVAGASVISTGDYTERLARALQRDGVVLYCAYWSEDCSSQKNFFGSAAGYLDYVECDQAGTNANPDECIAQKIEQYPTWIYKNQRATGVKSLSELAGMINFEQ